MRIGIDVSPLQDGNRLRGIGTYARTLLRGLAEVDSTHEFVLFARADLPLEFDEDDAPRGASVARLPYFRRFGRADTIASQFLLHPWRLRRYRLDLYHQLGLVADPRGNALVPGLVGCSVVTVHDLTPLRFPERFFTGKSLRRLVYASRLRQARRCRLVITDSESTRADVCALLGIPAARTVSVPLAVDRAFFGSRDRVSKPDAISSDSPYLLHVGGALPNKGLGVALQAVRALRTRGLPHRLVSVGPGPERGEELLVSLRDVDQDQLVGLYAHADALVFSTAYEGFGLPPLEAMAAGTPVVASRVASVPEVVGDAGLLVNPDDVPGFADALEQVLTNAAFRSSLIRRGRTRVRGFTPEALARRTLAVYERAVGQPS